jgi:hypothetical protein
MVVRIGLLALVGFLALCGALSLFLGNPDPSVTDTLRSRIRSLEVENRGMSTALRNGNGELGQCRSGVKRAVQETDHLRHQVMKLEEDGTGKTTAGD